MIVAFYILLALLAVGCLLKITDRPKSKQAGASEPTSEEPTVPEEECCGLHAVCERVATADVAETVEYFDDEELDGFAGRSSADYTTQEIDAFREVMLTLPPGEAALWARSLKRRGIALPEGLRDELIMIIGG